MDAIAFKCMIQHFLADVFVDFLLGCEIGVGRLKYSSKKKTKKTKKKTGLIYQLIHSTEMMRHLRHVTSRNDRNWNSCTIPSIREAFLGSL